MDIEIKYSETREDFEPYTSYATKKREATLEVAVFGGVDEVSKLRDIITKSVSKTEA